jgi:hypothetical protein
LEIKPNDLYYFLDEINERKKPEKEEQYLSPKQVCSMLDINNSTLWRWAQNNYLSPIKIGGKNRYKLSVIEKLLSSENV